MPTTIYRNRIYKQYIKPNHPMYHTLDDLTIKAKNLYNLALYTLRQEYFQSKQVIPKFQLQNFLKDTEAGKNLPAATSQQIIHNTYDNFKAFQNATKQYFKDPRNFTGKPKLPKYKKKFTKSIVYLDYRQLKILNNTELRLSNGIGTLKLPKYLTGIQVKSSKFDLYSEEPTLELIQLRIIPKQTCIEIEYVYNKQVSLPDKQPQMKVASIDLGLNNFAAIVTSDISKPGVLINGKGLKSYNHYFNKTLAKLQSNLPKNQYTSKRIQRLFFKRNNYFRTRMHQFSSCVIKHLQSEGVTHLIVGNNKNQKQNINLGRKVNQTFYQIPYDTFIKQLQYKCEECNIIFIMVEESYTSGTSFLDNETPTNQNYNPKRRVHRGLFETNMGIKINADINAAYQIIKKAYPAVTLRDPYQVNLQAIKVSIPL